MTLQGFASGDVRLEFGLSPESLITGDGSDSIQQWDLTRSTATHHFSGSREGKLLNLTSSAKGRWLAAAVGKEVLVFQDYPILNYGPFIQSVVDFLLVAAALFLVIKLMNTAKAKFEAKKDEAPAAPPEDVVLLREIRDALTRK